MTKGVSLGELESALVLANPLAAALHSLNVSGICTLEAPCKGGIAFIAQSTFLDTWTSAGGFSVLVTNEKLYEAVSAKADKETKVLKSKNPMLALARVSAFFNPDPVPTRTIHPSAEVHETAKLGKNVSIGPGCCVGKNVVLGDGCILHANVTVLNDTTIGSNGVLFPGVVVYARTVIGNNVRIHANSVIGADGFGYVQEFSEAGVKHVKIHHLGRVVIGNDVEVGASTTIDRGTVGDTVIGNGCIFDNHVQVGHNCQVGDGVIMCGTAGIAGSVTVGKNTVIGGYSAVSNGLKVGAGVKIAGYTMVFGDIPDGATWGGVPGRSLKEFWRLQALIGRLPELFDAYKQGRKKEL